MQLDDELRDTLESDGHEIMPNISLTSWGAKDISDLISSTDIKHPDPEPKKPTPNAWLRPPRMSRPEAPHTYEILPKQSPATITPTKASTKDNNNDKHANETPIDPKKLLAEIQSLKKDVLSQCKSYVEKEMQKINELQQEQNKKLEEIIKKNAEEQAITMKMIQELTTLVTSMHGKSTPHVTQHDDTPKKLSEKKIDTMDIDKDSHKRKEPQILRPLHRKTRATSNIE